MKTIPVALLCLLLACGCAQTGKKDTLSVGEYLKQADREPGPSDGLLQPIGKALSSASGPIDLSKDAPQFLNASEQFSRELFPSATVVGEGSVGRVPFMRMLQGPVPSGFDPSELTDALAKAGIDANVRTADLRRKTGKRATAWRYRGQTSQGIYRGFCVDVFEPAKAGEPREVFVQLWDSKQGIPQTYRDDQLDEHLIDRVQKMEARRSNVDGAPLIQRAAELEQRLQSTFPDAVTLRALLANEAVVKIRVANLNAIDVLRRLKDIGYALQMTDDESLWERSWSENGLDHRLGFFDAFPKKVSTISVSVSR